MKKLFLICSVLLFGCRNDIVDAEKLYADFQKDSLRKADSINKIIEETILSPASLDSIINWHTDSIVELKDNGNVKEVKHLVRVNLATVEYTEQNVNSGNEFPGFTTWTGSPEMTLIKTLVIDKKNGTILQNMVTDTVFYYYKPIFEEGDSSVKVNDIAEIEHFTFNTDTIECFEKPYGRKLKKIIKPGSVLASDMLLESRDDSGEYLDYYIHVVDKNYKNGYWVKRSTGMFSHEMGQGMGYWSNYHATLFLREK